MEPFVKKQAAKGPSLFLLPHWTEQYGGLTAGFSGRQGGVSEVPWQSLNMGLHVGDADDDVIANRQLLADAIGWPFEAWTCAEQVHGDVVAIISKRDRGKGRESRSSSVKDADAMVTNERNVLLTSFYADCVPLYFFEPNKGVIALAHAGWKGTVLEIARKTVEAMTASFGCEPALIEAAIGPSIGLCCYEVNEVVLERVIPLVKSLNLDLTDLTVPTVEGRSRINLKELNRQIMIKAGILPRRIEYSEWCTGCSRDLFFSHRMEGGATGRMVSWIGMSEGDLNA